jgi:hypothetical protein
MTSQNIIIDLLKYFSGVNEYKSAITKPMNFENTLISSGHFTRSEIAQCFDGCDQSIDGEMQPERIVMRKIVALSSLSDISFHARDHIDSYLFHPRLNRDLKDISPSALIDFRNNSSHPFNYVQPGLAKLRPNDSLCITGRLPGIADVYRINAAQEDINIFEEFSQTSSLNLAQEKVFGERLEWMDTLRRLVQEKISTGSRDYKSIIGDPFAVYSDNGLIFSFIMVPIKATKKNGFLTIQISAALYRV